MPNGGGKSLSPGHQRILLEEFLFYIEVLKPQRLNSRAKVAVFCRFFSDTYIFGLVV